MNAFYRDSYSQMLMLVASLPPKFILVVCFKIEDNL